MDELAKELVAFEDQNKLTAQGTQSCMLLRLSKAIERYNELHAAELKTTLGIDLCLNK